MQFLLGVYIGLVKLSGYGGKKTGLQVSVRQESHNRIQRRRLHVSGKNPQSQLDGE